MPSVAEIGCGEMSGMDVEATAGNGTLCRYANSAEDDSSWVLNVRSMTRFAPEERHDANTQQRERQPDNFRYG